MQLNIITTMLMVIIVTSCSIFRTQPEESKPIVVNKIAANYVNNKQYYYCINESCNHPSKLVNLTAEDLKPLEPESNVYTPNGQEESKPIVKDLIRKNCRKHKVKPLNFKKVKKCVCNEKQK